MKSTTKAWLEKIAKLNGVTVEDVLHYLRLLSNSPRVIHHLRLA